MMLGPNGVEGGNFRTAAALTKYEPAELPEIFRLQKDIESSAAMICAYASILDIERAQQVLNQLNAVMAQIREIPRKENHNG